MKNKQHDVIVVGGGPVGSYTAYLLARSGLDVGIFERNPSIGKDVNCTGIISEACIRKFNLPDAVISKSISSIKAISPSGVSVRYQSASPMAYVVNRGLFDNELNLMAKREGATTYLNSRGEDIKVSDTAFNIEVRSGENRKEFSSKVGVIATGFDPQSFRRIRRQPTDFLFGVQTDVVMDDLSDVEVYFGEKVAPGSFGWVVPTNGKSAKIGLIVKKSPGDFMKKFLRSPYISERINTVDPNIRCSPIPLNRIAKSFGERLIVVGEAAGQVKTTTGGGIYFGILCAEIAAETILKAVKGGDCGEKAMKGYELLWRKRLEPELRAGAMLRNLFTKLSDRQIDFLIDMAGKDGLMPVIDKACFDWHKDVISYLVRHFINKKLFGR